MRPIFLLVLILLPLGCLTAQKIDANALKAASTYGFIENKGQVIDQNNQPNPSVKFLCALPDLQVQIRDKGYSYEVKKEIRRIAAPESGGPKGKKGPDIVTYGIHRIDITFDGANQGWLWEASDAQSDYSNYYTTGTGESGITGVRTYRHLLARNVWDHIDIEFLASTDAEPVKYNIIVRPGGNPDVIRLRVEGAEVSNISPSGGLLLKTDYGDLEETIPLSFIEDSSDTNRENIEVRFQALGENVFGFQLPEGFSVKGKTLVIDPTPDRVWGTYYGGSESDHAYACKVDGNGNLYATGRTLSTNNIATAGSFQSSYGLNVDAFLCKFNSNGVRLWATYYGGSAEEEGLSCSLDNGAGNIYICGFTTSTNNIASSGSHQSTKGGAEDAFLSKFNSNGARQWGTFYGGSGNDRALACSTDVNGNIILTGFTTSINNISTPGAHQLSLADNKGAMVVKFNANGARQWGTYVGGDEGRDCAVDASGNVFITGLATSLTGISTTGAHQPNIGSTFDGFLMKFNTSGARQWGTYYGGTGDDWAESCAVDAAGNVLIFGRTNSSSGIATPGAYQTSFLGNNFDAFIAKFGTNGIRSWGTYYGGSGGYTICLKGIADASNNVYFTGYSDANNIASAGAYQTSKGGAGDAFLVKLNSSGARQWGTYYGGSFLDKGYGCGLDNNGNIYLCGETASSSAISSAGSHQIAFGGGTWDGFLAKFTQISCTTTATISSTTPTCSGQSNGSATVTASGSNAYTYLWNNGQTNATATNLAAGTYTVTVTGSNGCTTSTTATIANSPAVQAGFTYTINGGLVTFSNTSTNSTTYLWNFGNSQTSTQSNPTYAYNTPGNYNVCLTATGLCGNVQSCQTITISPPNDYCWHWQNPLPQGNLLDDVFFINELTGWAAGDFGTILKTTNGGVSWQAQISGTTNHLKSVYFTDNQVGWIVGESGAILKTTNGGTTWQAQSSSTVNTLLSVHFTDSQTGWAVGNGGTILKTTNGGNSWQAQISGTINYLGHVQFTDNQTGWIVGGSGTILKTTNGGITWQAQSSGTTQSFLAMYFIDNQVGWVAGLNGAILKTTNGGTSWQVQISGTTNWLYHVHFSGAQTGWIVGQNGTILKTTNGGVAWEAQASGTTNLLYSIHIIGNQTGWAVGQSGTILKTTSGGSSWQTQSSGMTDRLFSIHFLDSQTGWAVGDGGRVIKTINGGLSWQMQSSGTTNFLSSVFFTDNLNGWVAGYDGTILKTTNGGATWQLQNSGTANSFTSIYFTNNQTGWAVGWNSIILKTTNGGATWQPQNSGISVFWLNSVHLKDDQTGWAVGDGGTILKTTNGGNSWLPQISGTINSLNSVYFTDNQTGWVVGDGGTILKTTNGGNSWQYQNSGTTNSIESVHFTDNQTGWAVEIYGGTILKTTNGGATWLPQTSGATNALHSVYFTDSQTGWVVGDGGSILKYGHAQKPVVQNITLCKNVTAVPLSAIGTNLLWYTAPSGGTGSSVAPIPNTTAIGTTTYYVSQSPIGIGNCTESERAAIVVTVTAPTVSVSTTGGCSSNGTATATASGSTAPYSYQWSNNQSTQTISNLPTGTYTVTVTDAFGCTHTAIATVSGGVAPTASISSTVSPCVGQSTGSATVTASGGALPYTYIWSNGQTGATANNLLAGNYFVTVTGNNGCSSTATATISTAAAPTASISSTISPCAGQATGSATVTASGGVSPYTYIWSNGQTGATANNLLAGNYFVTVTGNNGCSSTATATISTAAAPTASISSTISPCAGQATGSATVTASGGVSPYTYIWSNGQTGATANNLVAGNHFVTVTGNNGCSSTVTATINTAASPTASISSTVPPCAGQSNGSITIVASGGVPPYTYTWSNGQSGATGINLAAGTYFIAVEDNNGCSSVVTATLTNIPVFNIELLTNPEPNGQSCQSSAAPQSGTPPYSYLWSNGQTTQTASDLPIGQFSVSVTDASGCASIQTGSCIPVSTNEISDIEFFSIKPNPANSYLSIQIRLKQAEDLQMRFFNSIGQQLYENAFNSQVIDEVIDLSDFPSGCYFLQFTTRNGSKSEIITIAR